MKGCGFLAWVIIKPSKVLRLVDWTSNGQISSRPHTTKTKQLKVANRKGNWKCPISANSRVKYYDLTRMMVNSSTGKKNHVCLEVWKFEKLWGIVELLVSSL